MQRPVSPLDPIILFNMEKRNIVAPDGKLGILLPGMGAVATTFIAGIHAIRAGAALPIGSLTQMGRLRIGKRTEKKIPLIREFVPLASLENLVFGGWDPIPEDAYRAAVRADVLKPEHLLPHRAALERIHPMTAVFDQEYVRRINGTNTKVGASKARLVDELREDIQRFRREHGCARLVMVWCGSTEAYRAPAPAHQSLVAFEKGLAESDPAIPPSMMYAYAALAEGVPYVNGSPNYSSDAPALVELAEKNRVPIAGKDFKTGQTLVKTVLAPMLRARLLGLSGWFSTNILGNRDGEVLDDPGSFRSKEITKSGVLDAILDRELFPELYRDFFHKIRIEYYPPRGDAKEGWDNIDLVGWLGYPMQLKVNFLCRDSILAAPIVLDLALFVDLAARAGLAGIQEWLSFYFKSPLHHPSVNPEHDLFTQLAKLENTLRWLQGEEMIHHLGQVYYGEKETHTV